MKITATVSTDSSRAVKSGILLAALNIFACAFIGSMTNVNHWFLVSAALGLFFALVERHLEAPTRRWSLPAYAISLLLGLVLWNFLVLSVAGGFCVGMLLGKLLFRFLTSGRIPIKEVECFFYEPTAKLDGSGKYQIDVMLSATNYNESKVNLVSLRQVLLGFIGSLLWKKAGFSILLSGEDGKEIRVDNPRGGNYGMLITSVIVEVEAAFVEQAAALFSTFGFKQLAKS